mmetsp:Transcript_41918/g.65510  ORF Transcript_41918/g.65510 Transcript_41918/m.65510 type:complete len:442 (-) Transcript_41918:26-1351(-)
MTGKTVVTSYSHARTGSSIIKRKDAGPTRTLSHVMNTAAWVRGENLMREKEEQNQRIKQADNHKKVARVLHDKALRRQFFQEQHTKREVLEYRAGQASQLYDLGDGMQALAAQSSYESRTSFETDATGPSTSKTARSVRTEVEPSDALEALERFARMPGRKSDDSKGLCQNGSIAHAAIEHQPRPKFGVDDTHRPVRRVVTGGAADRLHYSDGSLRVLLAPQVTKAEPTMTAKPLLLRDGGISTISQRTRTAAVRSDGSVADVEIRRLTPYHTGNPEFENVPFNWTTKLGQDAWEKKATTRAYLTKQFEFTNTRPDLDAIAEYYALKKVATEKEEASKIWEMIHAHRAKERDVVKRRMARRLVLQAKSGQSVAFGVAGECSQSFSEVSWESSGLSFDSEDLSKRWTGSWTPHSQAGGSLTHNAPGKLALSLKGPHQPRQEH